jgi:hypothetical protein
MRDINRRAFLGIGGSLLLAGTASASTHGGRGGDLSVPAGLIQVGRYESGLYDEGGAEIPTYDPKTKRLFVVNAGAGVVDVLTIANPTRPRKIDEIDSSSAVADAGDTNSVAVSDGVLAVAIANADEQANGYVAFYDTASRRLLNTVEVGPLPDMVTFTPDGTAALTANEGEPTSDYGTDPEGSISVVDLSNGVENATVVEAGFGEFNASGSTPVDDDVRVYGPGSTVAQDLEPEYIAVSADSNWAYATLQENNALAVVDIENRVVADVLPLGFKDHTLAENGVGESNALDAIDDGVGNIENQPLLGMYQPDSIASIEIDGDDYLVTANEGDAREYRALFEVGIVTDTDEGFVLEINDEGEFEDEDGTERDSETADVPIDEDAFPDGKLEELEGLEATAVDGLNSSGEIEQLYTFGGRSFAIWRAEEDGVELVYESGDWLEQLTDAVLPDEFNSDDDSVNDLDGESAASGPEPEGIAVGYVDDTPVAFVGLEEIGGVAMFDISDPTNPTYVDYVNNRVWDLTELGLDADADLGDALEAGLIEPGAAGDLGPEGLLFIPAEDAPVNIPYLPVDVPLLVVGNEVSGTTSIYAVGV